MKRRILGLLMALCLIVGLLPVTSLAADKPDIDLYYNIVGSSAHKTLAAGGNAAYWITKLNTGDNRYYLSGSDATNWNVKLEYPADGIPTLTLKDATITSEITLELRGYSGAATAFDGDVKLVLEGDNYISRNNPYNSDIFFNITGTATVTGNGKLKISHSGNAASMALIKSNGNLVLDNVDLDLDVPPSYARCFNGIIVSGNMTVKGGNLSVTGWNPYSTGQATLPDGVSGFWYSYRSLYNGIKVDGDLTVENGADVTVYGAPTNAVPELVKVGGTFAIKDSDVEIGILKGTYETVLGKESAPTMSLSFTNGYTVATSGSVGTYDPDTDTFTAPAEDTQDSYTNISDATLTGKKYFKVTHGCFAANDDHDCTTATACDVCGEPMGTAQSAHTPAADDGDCTTAVLCANPGCTQVVTAAAAAHTPEADDGDCTTAIKCSVCGTETTAAKQSHTSPDDRTSCDQAANCTECGKQIPAGQHTGGTATCKDKAVCTVCSQPYGELGTHTGGTATCKDKAVCTVCSQPYGELSTAHVPEADDGDCTTAIKCSVCGGEAVAAKTHAYTNGSDTTCDNAGCTHTRVIEPKPDFTFSFATDGTKKDNGDGTFKVESSNMTTGTGKATLIMKAGDPAKYYTTGNYSTIPELAQKTFMKETNDTTNWNVKVEYPADGIPTVTLKGAVINNSAGLQFGGVAAAFKGDTKLVIETDSVINTGYTYQAALGFNHTGTATITGPGKLTVQSNAHGSTSGAIKSNNANLIFDNANVRVLLSEEWGAAFGIAVKGADMTVKGGSLKVVGYDDSKTTHYEGKDTGYNLNANACLGGIWITKTDDTATNGNLTIEGGANVSVAMSTTHPYSDYNKHKDQTVYVDGKFVIKDSTFEVGLIGKTIAEATLFGSLPTLEFTNNSYTVTATKTKKPTFTPVDYEYDQYTKDGTMAHDASKEVDVFDADTKLSQLTYFRVTPGGSGSGSAGGSGSSSSPNTGDISVLLTAGLALASAVGMGGVTVLRKKNG